MPVVRIHEFNDLQRAIIKSMYNQVKNRCNDGLWRDFDADITVDNRRVKFSCKFRIHNGYLTFAKREIKDEQNNILLPYY